MKSLTHRNIVGLLTVIGMTASAQIPTLSQDTQARNTPASTAVSTTPIADEIVRAERNLERTSELYKLGTVAFTDVSKANIELAEARIRQAKIRQEPQTIMENLHTIVTHREEILNLANDRYKAGVVTRAEVNLARVALAEAHIRLQSHILVAAREENLSYTVALFEAGVVTRKEVEDATKALTEARLRLEHNASLRQ